ncbi:MAG TPA: GTPase Era [Candidatus Limnocylindria bacterium]|nr:GTPase Era [Candidatus Limnocylindria bacterium]
MSEHRCGDVAIVGRPNVGKSTLLNALVGAKVSIATPRPQTTRNRIAGIRTVPGAQIIFLDTPGLHAARSPLNRRMVQTARDTLSVADVVLLVLDATAGLTRPNAGLLDELVGRRAKLVIALNKVDRTAKPALLPLLAEIGSRWPGPAVVPVSATRGVQLDALLDEIVRLLPAGPPRFEADDYTTASMRFLAQELIREQVFLATEQEIPYGSAVVVERWEDDPGRNLVVIQATVLVERPAHKGIVIGKGGARLRTIGQAARLEIEQLVGKRVYLELFVRVEPGWMRRADRVAELDP